MAATPFFMKPLPFRGPLWFARLEFRDFLRTHPSVAAEYASLKHELAKRYEFDREAYTDSKLPFVERVLRMANQSDSATGRSG